jgi:hypothetical protein
MKSIRLVESNIAFAETTVSGGYDRFYIRSTTGKSRSVTVAHGTYADGTEIAVALQTALTTQASDLDVTVTYVDGRLKFESGNDFTIDDTDVNATDSMGRSVTSGSSDSIATVAGLDDVVYSTFNGTVFEATAPYDVYTGKERYLVLSLDLAGDLVSNAPTWNALSTLTEGQREYRSTAQVDLSSIRTVERIRVTITRPSGARYDFGNLNHRLEFCVCS